MSRFEETNRANRIKRFLEDDGWYVKNMHGNKFQQGIPDKLCFHPKYKQRWVEVKKPSGYAFTKAQLEWFPLIDKCGIGIWIMNDGTVEEYMKLFKPPNWKEYIRAKDLPKFQAYHPWFTV